MTQDRLTDIFMWFHRHPELSYEEYGTTERIREILEEEGIEILPEKLETGLAAVVRGKKPGAMQMLRSDIDALPVTEATGLSYASECPGKMHACGHDFHITAGIGTAVELQKRREELCGAVKFIFQPAEETSLGALKITETSLLSDVEKAWCIHADPTNEANVVAIREGYVAAACDHFKVVVEGCGCHGAHPDDGIDPIPAACAIVQAFQTIVSRNRNPFHPALLSVTRIQAGNTWNVIPATAELEGTVRTLDKKDQELFQRRFREIVEQTAAAYGCSARAEWMTCSPAVYNDTKMTGLAGKVAERLGRRTAVEEQSLGGDDFSFYEEKIPGCYLKIGTGIGPTIHQPGFQVDLSVLWPTVEYLTELLLAAGR